MTRRQSADLTPSIPESGMCNHAFEFALAETIAGAESRVKSVTLPGGLRLPYVEQGDPAGIPIVLLHGYTDSWTSFARLLDHLPHRFRAIALSQRGHGDAGRPLRAYHPRDFADDLADFLDAVGIDAAVIVGHSMGSLVAQRFAIEYPARVRGLVLIGAFTGLGRNPLIRELWESTVATMTDPVDPAFVREFQLSTLATPVPSDFLDLVVAESLKLPARLWREVLAGQMDENVVGELDRIASPTLVLWGDRDDLFPQRREQERLAAAIGDARLVVYPGIGHALHWEEPVRVAADLASFAQGLGR
jgi:non-heme chloroperoxidase